MRRELVVLACLAGTALGCTRTQSLGRLPSDQPPSVEGQRVAATTATPGTGDEAPLPDIYLMRAQARLYLGTEASPATTDLTYLAVAHASEDGSSSVWHERPCHLWAQAPDREPAAHDPDARLEVSGSVERPLTLGAEQWRAAAVPVSVGFRAREGQQGTLPAHARSSAVVDADADGYPGVTLDVSMEGHACALDVVMRWSVAMEGEVEQDMLWGQRAHDEGSAVRVLAARGQGPCADLVGSTDMRLQGGELTLTGPVPLTFMTRCPTREEFALYTSPIP